MTELDAIRERLAPPPRPTVEQRDVCAAGECGGCVVCWGPPIPVFGPATVGVLLAHMDRLTAERDSLQINSEELRNALVDVSLERDRLRDLAAALEAELAEATEHLAGGRP